MQADASVRFFEQQFQRQLREEAPQLNPFEELALPHLSGRVLDYGCGLGNLALAAARRGCAVLALDASPTAIAHLRQAADQEGLPIETREADLTGYTLAADFDAVVCIGLLMFLDCDSALRQLAQLQARLRPGGVAVLNVLVEGTTYLDMFDPLCHCLLGAQRWRERFAGWAIDLFETREYPAPGGTVKSFVTIIAHKPAG